MNQKSYYKAHGKKYLFDGGTRNTENGNAIQTRFKNYYRKLNIPLFVIPQPKKQMLM